MTRGITPSLYFTTERVLARKTPPPTLFHWTRSLDRALAILADNALRGRPTLSTTENPAFSVPGPVVFVLSTQAIIRRGFVLWPYLWQRGAAQEAEWVVADRDSASEGGVVLSAKPVSLPLRGVVRQVGYTPGWSGRRGAERGFHDRVRAIRAAAGRLDIPVRLFDWERWWARRTW